MNSNSAATISQSTRSLTDNIYNDVKYESQDHKERQAIDMDTYNANIPEIKYIPDNTVFDWHRDYIPWLELLK